MEASRPTLPNPSPYLEASLARWADRGSLARRDVEIMMEGLEVKGHFLEGLRLKIHQHQKDDVAQLKEARQESGAQWAERLKRLEAWMGVSAELSQVAKRIRAWQNRFVWFDHAKAVLARYSAGLERKASALEKTLPSLAQWTKEWSDHLILKESELSGVLVHGATTIEESMITASKKRAFLEDVYKAREKEGELARHFKILRGQANFALERLARVESWISQKAESHPAYFEMQKNQVWETWRPYHTRFTQLREITLHQALLFEEGRTRLRALYDTLQRMRVVQDEPPVRRPLLERLFHARED
jgi:hypothetical protein